MSALPICPLYKYTEQQCIGCDGAGCGFSTLRISFPDVGARKKHMYEYCEADYERCKAYEVMAGEGE